MIPAEIHYRDRSNAFNAYQFITFMQKMKKLVQELGKVLLSKALARSMYPLDLTEDSEIFFEVGSDGALFEK